MESLLIEITNFFDQETKHKKMKIRTVQGLAYGRVLHIVSGNFLNKVQVQGGFNINFLCNGGMSKRLRTIFDPASIFDSSSGRNQSLLAVPVFFWRNETLVWNYEIYHEQNPDLAFDRAQQPIQVSFKDFDCRNWDMGLQQVPVSFTPYRSKYGSFGMNYIAEKAGALPVNKRAGNVQSS
jgi:hypothetical protein